jgi:hypothetical protein
MWNNMAQGHARSRMLSMTVLTTRRQFSTAEELLNTTPLAFVIMDAQSNYYLIGAKEPPYPIVEISKGISEEENVNNIKVTFSRRKSLLLCSI